MKQWIQSLICDCHVYIALMVRNVSSFWSITSSTTKSFGRGEYHCVSSGALIMRALWYVVYSTIVLLLTIIKFYWRFNTILIIILLHSKFRFNAVSMILVGVGYSYY